MLEWPCSFMHGKSILQGQCRCQVRCGVPGQCFDGQKCNSGCCFCMACMSKVKCFMKWVHTWQTWRAGPGRGSCLGQADPMERLCRHLYLTRNRKLGMPFHQHIVVFHLHGTKRSHVLNSTTIYCQPLYEGFPCVLWPTIPWGKFIVLGIWYF